jgi:hypothetical protein
MKTLRDLPLVFLTAALSAFAAEKGVITVTHDLPAARPAETIAVPWKEIVQTLPGAEIQHLAVEDQAGHSLPYQVTHGSSVGYATQGTEEQYDELVFQHDFAAGEISAVFTVEKSAGLAPVFPAQVFARYVPERLDDFAWENDRMAHRTYGPALAAPAGPGSGQEVLISSGLDVWCKRVRYPIIDRWYHIGHYHDDVGEGMDQYHVGASRGCGGTGVWDGRQLHVSRNYQTWKVLDNGPIRAIFELTYESWSAHGVIVSETKRFTIDAGHNLDQIDSTFTVVGPTKTITVGIGLNKEPVDADQAVRTVLTPAPAAGSLTQWFEQKTNGAIGTAIIVPGAPFQGFAEDERNQLILAEATSGQPLRYYVGASWSKAGDFSTAAEWNAYVAAWAARLHAPLKVTLTPAT